MNDIKNEIYDKIKTYFDNKEQSLDQKIGVAYPCFDHNEVIQVLDSLLNMQISQGPKVKEFERLYSKYIGTKYGVACNSGSSANLLALTALIQAGYLKEGDEVIVPAATFTTVISPIVQCKLVPVFVDVEMDTYNNCPTAIENAINEKTKLIMVVHSLGYPAKMKQIIDIAKKHNLFVLEDCCESHGSSIDNQKVGSFGDISTFSFFVAHNMTTGEGGMVMTDDEKLYDILTSIREFGRLKNYEPNQPRFYYNDGYLTDYDERYVFTAVGYNLRMTDLAASLGIEQLKKLDDFNDKRVKNATFFNEHLSKYNSLILPKLLDGYYHSYYGYPITISKDSNFTRKELVNHLEKDGIETRAFMGGNLSIQPAYRNIVKKISEHMPNTNVILHNTFFIGCHPYLTEQQKNRIINSFESFFAKLK
jgi:CDP-6-deoxy-D-xylo-4-hexulose-3-dehydrase